ncbi:MAG TPA: sigma-70 family RNA polymerase sigma factor [Myxococcales bacterium]|jgi:RNA polymerase sigma-70 factor (ECF subfamily)
MAETVRPSFQDVYQADFTYVWNTLRRLGVRSADLKDVAHDVFVIAYRRFEEYDAGRPVRPWLFGIAFRVVAHLRRDEKTKPAASESVCVDELFSSEPSPEDDLRTRQDRELVAAALTSLDLDRRAVFVMHELDGCPVPEIARELSIPLNTAYSRLRLARRDFVDAVKRQQARRGEVRP